MARHRKIPGKKHKGVKDPEKQRAKREKILRPMQNSLPKILDDQEMPKKLKQMIRGRDAAKQLMQEKKEKKKEALLKMNDPDTINEGIRKKEEKRLLDSSKHMGYEMRLAGMSRPLKPVPVFKQESGETQRRFFNRMETTVQQFLKQRNYEAKYNIDLVEDPNTGKTTFVDRPKDELESELTKKKHEKLAKKGIVVKSKEEKRQLKRQKEKERKSKKKQRRGGTSKEVDDYKAIGEVAKPFFNDVVDAPPTLKIPRGATLSTETRRPGATKNLLLMDKLKSTSKTGEIIHKKKKVEEMSLATKERMRIERERVIKEYRNLKKKNFPL